MEEEFHSIILDGFKERVKRTFESLPEARADGERRVYVDLMKFVAHLYRDADEYGYTWKPDQLQEAVKSMENATSAEFTQDYAST